MNLKIGLITSLILYASCFSIAAQKQEYKLVWKENFKGKSFNTQSWSKIPRGSADWNRHMSNENSLYDIKKGKLILRGMMNSGIVPSDTARFITGGLFTKGKRNIKYGKVEVKAKLGCGQGAWPAIWMLPENGKWPDGGEIDIMEHLNFDTIAYQTIHTYYTYVLKEEKNPPHGSTGPIKRDGFNVYAVEILPDSLTLSINGKKTFSYPRITTSKKGQYPFGTPYYLLIDMQIEGSWVGKANPKDYPVEMEIDWVKMYEWKEKSNNK